MPSTPLDAMTPTTPDASRENGRSSWVTNLRRRLRSTVCLLGGAALIGFGSTSAEAQVQPTPVYADTGAQAVWPQSPVPPQAAPPMQPYPAISPFYPANVYFTTHVNRGGTWFKEILSKDRNYYFSAEATFFRVDDAGAKEIGATPLRGALSPTGQLESGPISELRVGGAVPNITGDPATTGTVLVSLFNQVTPEFVLIGPGVFPYPLISFDENLPISDNDLDFVGNNLVAPIRTLGELGDSSAVGTRVRWGSQLDDGTGFEFSGFWSGKISSISSRGTDNINGFPLSSTLVFLNDNTLLGIQNGGLSLDNGLPTFTSLGNTSGITGSTQKYDLLYSIAQDTQVFGGAFNIFQRPLLTSDAFRLQLVWGGEYTQIDEGFRFRGIDSGISYDLEDLQSAAGILPSGNAGGGGGGGAGATIGGRIQATSLLIPSPNGVPDRFFEAWLNSDTVNHIAGPTVGLRYEFGGDSGFHLFGESTFGLMANYTKTDIDSHNIAEQTHSKTVYGLDFLVDPVTGNPRPADFARAASEADHTHVSPMFRQRFQGEIGVGALIPPLRKTELFENAQLTLGYTITIIGKVQRPGEAIYWRGFNGDRETSFPYAISDLSTFVTQEANLGVEWNY